jgi:hypothetical protein
MRTVCHCLHVSRGDIVPAVWPLKCSFSPTLGSRVLIPDIFPPAQLTRNMTTGSFTYTPVPCLWILHTPIIRMPYTSTLNASLQIVLLKKSGFHDGDNWHYGI